MSSKPDSAEPQRCGLLFVVAAPSGAGKTSLVHALVNSDHDLVISVSYTTRKPRDGEIDGHHYHFTSPEHFQAMVKADQFLEFARVFDHHYGTHESTTRQILESGRDVVLEIDWQGARQVRVSFPDCHSIFILPPSLPELRQRLGNRGQDSAEVIDGRMAKAQAEISHCHEFQHVIVNDDFETALAELQALVRACREGQVPVKADHEELLAQLLGKG